MDKQPEACEICGINFSGFELTCDCVNRQDPAFYNWGGGSEIVWQKPEHDFYVVRAGEMRIHYKEGDAEETLRYTSDLDELGIDTDKKLAEIGERLGEEGFSWVNNSWFEIYSNEDSDFFSEPLHELDEAIVNAIRLSEGKEIK
jgi:hypothetical protein